MDLPAAGERAPLPVRAGFVLALGVLAGLTVPVGTSPPPGGALLVVDLVVAVLSTAAVVPLIAVRPPVRVAVGLAVLAAVSPAATPAATAGALRIARTRPLATAAAVAALGAAAHAVRYAWRPTDGLPFGWWLALVLIAHAALLGWGAYAQSRAALLASLRERARRAEADQESRVAQARSAERTRIAREMHDVLAHRLSLVATTAGAIEFRPDASPERIAAATGVLRSHAHAALEDLREVIGVLRADPEDGRPQPTAADVPCLVAEVRAAGVEVAFHDDLGADPGGSTGRTVYRVVQEGLTNARKHAAGRPVEVRLTGGEEIVVEIVNPTGPGAGAPGSGTGLVGLAERVDLAGGRLEHGPVDGRFRLVAALPWPEGA
ncbi:sensor histidine kinase [Pseudonocardia humida]|uniref:histidine kinase n=1 Tax=Pseudonocardia humida TaxID=2800819 RepID=A0ABT1A0X9_9PSEU|nr:histidine kinase [Pseudonocardia humida]MCO1656657.1 sensor histidine kinase [Pseudonocardia humida]